MEIVEEKPVITLYGVFQTIRKYDYDKSIVILERTFNGQIVSTETFYLD